jgi:hypothetical protein
MPQTIEISVSEEMLQLLDEKARRSGLEREAYVSLLLSKDLSRPATLAQVLQPFRDQVNGSAITDAELDQILNQARDDMHGEKHS